ncbi:hypothetical protein SAMN02745134_00354 [Clostridium acidisoli DSM 12555]|uniref:Uncharacterized protein n=1 Tax=Clostridium acidisoli DSM 12555 TaxID=1121291 RepID=A0A1W1X0L1_9CLOT|nr:hypothetical protein [Clostridium acidisoli]SMC17492.1 hypothetical protein SAMN02745134_00354 [Clostridium acidisoli DSM 12555]
MIKENKNKPKLLSIQMFQVAFDYIIKHENIEDKEKYKKEHKIVIIDKEKDNTLRNIQATIIYSDGSKQIVDIYEEVRTVKESKRTNNSLKFINLDITNDGYMQENFTCDNPEIGTISFISTGTEEDLTNFLKGMIFDYARRNKLID